MFTGKGFEELNKENIFKKISEYDVFKYYIPSFEDIGKKFSSPLRRDSNPSCVINSYNNTLFYKDFGTGETYTAVAFVMTKYNMNFNEALTIISSDFNLGLHNREVTAKSMGYSGVKNSKFKNISDNVSSIIKIKRRNWNDTIDREYWGKYGFNKSLLKFYNIYPISHLWIGNSYITINKNKPSYAFVIETGKYKILSPYSEYKWINNCNNSMLQGFKQLPEKGELLVITSSLKDTMMLYKFGYNAVAPGSENTIIKEEDINKLRNRFNNIIVFFDNDTAGINSAEVYHNLYGFNYIYLLEGNAKDISDYYLEYGKEKTCYKLNQLLLSYVKN